MADEKCEKKSEEKTERKTAREIIENYDGPKVRIMEVCGTHTHEIFRLGIRKLLPEQVELISGPGCPVCVTPVSFIDEAIYLALEKGVTICTFGDLVRVPGTKMSLAGAREQGADIHVVYSPADAEKYAGEHPDKQVTFLSVGFETTTPASCLSVKAAKENGQPVLMGSLRYKGTDIYGLSGKVKSVNGNEESLKFDQAGNLIAMQNKFGDEAAYQYVTATSYKVEGWGDYVVNIESKDGMRTDICPDADTNTELDQTYMFDKRNRIISHQFTSHMAYVTWKYSYEGDSKYPATMIQEHPEEGNTTYRYTYTKFDKHKNWIERKVSYTTEYDKYDDNGNYVGDEYTAPEEYTEKRTIEYW